MAFHPLHDSEYVGGAVTAVALAGDVPDPKPAWPMGGELSALALPTETLFPHTKTVRPGMDELEGPGAGAEDAFEDAAVEEPPSVSA